MAIEIFTTQGPDITAEFAGGGCLEKSGVIWTYERDGKIGISAEPELAVMGAEGLFNGKAIWSSRSRNIKKGGE